MADAAPAWDLYRTFLAVAQERSLSGAARTLGLAQPTVGRHIDALEAAVGFQLFTRSQHGLSPTEGAEELRPYADALSATAAALIRVAAAQGDTVRGVVRMTASEVVGAEIVPPILAGLREQYPQLVIELVLSNTMEDLLRRDADIAVRMVRPTQGALVAKHLGPIEVGLHAHRRYLARHGTPARREDLGAHALIGFDRESAPIRDIMKRLGGFTRQNFHAARQQRSGAARG